MDELVTVIIPVFNREKTLECCVNSVLEQSWKELEVLIVDDGSSDRTPEICRSIAEKDSRVRVIRQTNQGVSAARNKGLQEAKGEFLAWVDSDDWIEKDMIRVLMEGLLCTNSDIAVCGMAEEIGGGVRVSGFPEETVLSGKEARRLLLEDEQMHSYLCDKLFKRELFTDVVFPVGHRYEDLAVLYPVMEKAERVVCLPYVGYHYVETAGSTVHSWTYSHARDYYLAWKNIYSHVTNKDPEYEKMALLQLIRSVIPVWCRASYSSSKEERAQDAALYQEMKRLVKDNRELIPNLPHTGVLGRIVLWSIVLFGEASRKRFNPLAIAYCLRHRGKE